MRRRSPDLALVVFVDHAGCRWLRGLRRGFRHCFVALRQERAWLICDCLKHRIELASLPADFDLAGFYAARGHRVLAGPPTADPVRSGVHLAPLTCVSVAKRLVGVRAARIVTPWQLFRHLRGVPAAAWREIDAPTTATAKFRLTSRKN
jgi:hypothetical protein